MTEEQDDTREFCITCALGDVLFEMDTLMGQLKKCTRTLHRQKCEHLLLEIFKKVYGVREHVKNLHQLEGVMH